MDYKKELNDFEKATLKIRKKQVFGRIYIPKSENEQQKHGNDTDLRDKYLEMKEKGLITPKGYNISPLDTVGKRKYHSSVGKRSRNYLFKTNTNPTKQ